VADDSMTTKIVFSLSACHTSAPMQFVKFFITLNVSSMCLRNPWWNRKIWASRTKGVSRKISRGWTNG